VKLENEFTVPVDIDTVYAALNDPEKVTPCFPGATLDSQDGDDFTGTVKVKLGPISMTYKGKGTFVERDSTNHKVVVDAQGRDSRGNGTASAKATLSMTDDGGKTKVTVVTEMQITGKPAQFGRGVMSDVGDKILGQFASCLADEFADAPAPEATSAAAPEATPAAASSQGASTPAAPVATGVEPISADATPVTAPPAPAPVAVGSGAPEAMAMPTSVGTAASSSSPTAATPGASPSAGAGQARPTPKPRQQAEAIDLLDSSRDAVLKRLGPVGAGAGVLALIVAIIVIIRGRSS